MINAVQTLTGDVRETGIQGLSAYEVYVKNGGTLSEAEWLESLKAEGGISLEEAIAITGELENLSTEDKNNLVNAINEVDSEISGLENILTDILEAIQAGGTTASTIAEIEQLIVSYFENKTVEEVEA